MSNELSPLQSVQESIKARIQSEFINLIPDEMWDRMVAGQIAEFTNDKPEPYNRGGTVPSPLKVMIRQAIEEQANAGVKEALKRVSGDSWATYADTVVSEAMKKVISDHFDEILKSVQSGMVQAAVFMTVNKMREGIANGMRF